MHSLVSRMRPLAGFLVVVVVMVFGCGPTLKDEDYVAYCPKCNDEVSYGKATAGMRCIPCGPNGPYRLKGVRGEERTPAGWPALVAWGIVAAVILLGGVNLWFVYQKIRREAAAAKAAANLRCRCPGCRRKYAYSVDQVGFTAICPRCKMKFPMPAPPPEEA